MALLLLSGLSSFPPPYSAELDFNDEVGRVQHIGLAAGAEWSGGASSDEKGFAVRRSWTVTPKVPWTSYANELTRNLQPAYRCRLTNESEAFCVRRLPGDVLRLAVASDGPVVGATARFSLEIHPD